MEPKIFWPAGEREGLYPDTIHHSLDPDGCLVQQGLIPKPIEITAKVMVRITARSAV
jgi:hypothetical protein